MAERISSPSWEAARSDALSAGTPLAEVDPDRSEVLVYVFRGGRAAQYGHNHVILVRKLKGFASLPQSVSDRARFDLEFRLDDMEVDPPDIRERLGPNFASVLSDDDREGTRRHMLGPKGLDAERYPTVRLRSAFVTGAAPRFAADTVIGLHGQQRTQGIAIRLDASPDGLTASGSLVLRQSDFGIVPYSVLGGLLSVEDALHIEFHLQTRPPPAPGSVR